MSKTMFDTKADILYKNGKIYTVDSNFSVADAFCITNDRFLAVGKESELKKFCTDQTKVIDLEGKTVLPGLIDSHLHLSDVGATKKNLNLLGKSKEEILDMVREAVKKAAPGQWIIGRGWDQTVWAVPEFPTMQELDAISTENPIYLRRACEHASWANSKAFQLAGVTKDSKDPVGGEILRTDAGELLGIVTDQVQDAFRNVIPAYTPEDYAELALLAQEEFFENGLTSVHDAGSPPEVISVWEKLYRENKMDVRIYGMLRVPGRPSYERMISTARKFFKDGIRVGLYDNHLTVRSFKLSSDGSLGARSAWMLEEYNDRPGHCGNGKLTDEELYITTMEARRAGFQMIVHAIGDACNRQCLDVYEQVLNEMPLSDHRYRIEHAQIVHLDDIARFVELGVVPAFQTIHLATDKNSAEDRVGDRVAGAYAWRKFLNAGCKGLPNGTDAPVEPVNPFPGIYTAITRKDLQGKPENGWYPEEALTREEALRSYTVWSAYAAFEEELKGSIEKGKLADFIVIDKDMMACAEQEIKDIKVLKTVVGGKEVYRKQ